MYIVARLRPDGRLITSGIPHIHHSLGDAQREAKRLAEAYLGETFLPLKAMKSFKKEKKYAGIYN